MYVKIIKQNKTKVKEKKNNKNNNQLTKYHQY